MKKVFIVPVLVILLVVFTSGMASAEWLYATRGNTFVHVTTDQYSDTIGVFMKGEKIWVYGHTYTPDGRNWCKVSYLGETGYISDRYSSYSVSDEGAYTDVNSGVTDPYYYDDYEDYDDDEEYYYDIYPFEYQTDFKFVARQKVAIKESIGSEFTIGYLQKGEAIYGSMMYTGQGDNVWLEVYVGDDYQCGYVPVSNLIIKSGNFPNLARYMVVSGGSINVRESADINSRSLRVLNQGDLLVVEYYVCVNDGENRIWAYCTDSSSNDIGFVSVKYLMPEAEW